MSEPLRADAERNRARLLDAAREVFAEHGLDVSMRRIARHAGVSEPTLRRRFESREALVAEAFQDAVAHYADLAERIREHEDAWVGFARFVHEVAALQLANRGLTEVLALTFPVSMRVEAHRVRAYRAIEVIIDRAQQQGALRADFLPEDLVMILMAHAGVVTAAGELAPAFSARLLAYLLQSFAAPGAGDLPPAPSAAAAYRAMLRLHGRTTTN